MIAAGAFAAGWRRDLTTALSAVPLMLGGAGVALIGVARFAASGGPQLAGQEFAVLLAVASLALVALGVGIAGREGSR
jgi:NADH:ubiquinone oxidoreductase subunit K